MLHDLRATFRRRYSRRLVGDGGTSGRELDGEGAVAEEALDEELARTLRLLRRRLLLPAGRQCDRVYY